MKALAACDILSSACRPGKYLVLGNHTCMLIQYSLNHVARQSSKTHILWRDAPNPLVNILHRPEILSLAQRLNSLNTGENPVHVCYNPLLHFSKTLMLSLCCCL